MVGALSGPGSPHFRGRFIIAVLVVDSKPGLTLPLPRKAPVRWLHVLITMFTRLSNLVRGFLGLFISGLEKKNPEALIELEKENIRKQIAKFNAGLAAHAGLCERLMSQVKQLEREEQDLRSKATANLRAGNQELAGQYALRLQTIKRELAENSTQLGDAEKTYKELVDARDTSVKAAREKIESLKRDISEMRMKSAVAELNEMAAGMIGSIGGSGDTLNRLHEMVREEKEKAGGRARVARDSLDFSDIKAQASEQAALQQQALADFAAAEGLALPGAATPAATETTTTERSMGGTAAS